MQSENNAWAPEASVGFWLNRASRSLLRLHEARLRALGVGTSHIPVLLTLDSEGPLPQKALAAAARVEQPTMAEMLARMERDGLVERRPNPADRRSSLSSLTRRSRAQVPKAKAAMLQGEHDATAGLSAEEKAQLVTLLKRVAASLEATDGSG